MTAEEWIGRRDSMSSLVSPSLWQNYVAVGSMQKGDYIVVNEQKAADVDEWVAYEKEGHGGRSLNNWIRKGSPEDGLSTCSCYRSGEAKTG